MNTKLLFVCSAFFACYAAEVTALTNSEFFNLVQPYITDVVVEDVAYQEKTQYDVNAFEVDDVITLPGGPDDEVDIEYIIRKLNLAEELQEFLGEPSSLRDRRGICQCKKDYCDCCVGHTFSVSLWIKKFSFKLQACVAAAYNPKTHDTEFSVTFNNHRLFHHTINLKNPPRMCFGVPPVSGRVRACVELYNINFGQKSACVRLAVEVNIWVKTFKIQVDIACFQIPMMGKIDGQDVIFLTRDSKRFSIESVPGVKREQSETLMVAIENYDKWSEP